MPRRKYQKIDPDLQNMYNKDNAEAVEEAKKQHTSISDRYGSKGKMFDTFKTKEEYDKIEIDIPKGLNEDFVTAIVMGAMLREDRLNKRDMTTSSMGQASPLEFNRTMITQNFIGGDVRQGEFLTLLPQARREAKEALKEYSEGKPEKAMKMLNDFIDSRADATRQMSIHGDGNKSDVRSPESLTIMLGAKLVGQPPMNARGTYPEHEIMRLKNYQKMYDARNEANALRDKMYNHPPAANSPERKKMVEDLLFFECIKNINKIEVDYNENKREQEIVTRMYENLGITVYDGQDPRYDETIPDKLSADPKMKDEINKINAAYQATHISDLQMILAQPDGLEKLRGYYKDAIRKSDRYKDLVEAEGSEIMDEIQDMVNLDFRREYPNVKVPNVSKEYNKKLEANYEKTLKECEKNFDKIVIDKGLLYEEDKKEYGIQSFSKEDLKKNAKIIDDMYQSLDDNDSWYKPSSKQFKDLKKELKSLKEMAERMAKNGNEPTAKELSDYEKKAREVNALTESYIDYKKVAEGDYAEARLKAVQNVRRHLGANLKSIQIVSETQFEKQQEDLKDAMNKEYNKNIELAKMQEVVNANKKITDSMNRFADRVDRLNKSDLGRSENYSIFFGDKYTKEDVKENVPAGYTVWRTGGYSVALMAMAAEGKYTMEQLLDFNQFQKEKQEMFDKVFTAMKDKTKENQEWIAKQIYEGHKAAFKMIDECAEQVDFNDPNYLLDPNENKMEGMMRVVFDSWQEMSHCQDEIVALAQKENPKIKTYQDHKESISAKMGPISSSTQLISKALVQMKDITEGKRLPENYARPIVLQMIQGKLATLGMKEFAQKDENGQLLPFSERFTKDVGEKLGMDEILAGMNGDISSLGKQLEDNETFIKVMPKILDGTMTKDISILRDPNNPDPFTSVKIKGLPSKEQLISAIKYEEMAQKEPDKLDFMKDTALSKYDEENKKASPIRKTYIEKAKNAVKTLHEMIKTGVDIVGEKREVAKNCLKDIMTEKFVGVMEKSGAKLPVGSEKEINKAIEKLPAFDKATEFIGVGDLGEFCFEGKANQFVKESVVDIQKNLAEVQKEAQLQAQKDLLKQGEELGEKQPENPQIKEPKLEAPGSGGLPSL